MERLDVYLCNQPVGTLTRSDAGDLSFRYLPEYLKSNAIPLSSTLPLDTMPFKERDIAAFFSNLLPDESVRQKIADILHLTPEDTFGLLRLIGGDCAGAVAFYEPGKSPATVAQPTYRELSTSEAASLLSDLSNRPLGIGDDFRGISGAGAQDKLIACLRDGKILLPLNGTPSTHIIKPAIDRFPESVFNEWFCMRLLKACGFDTADCDILEVDGTPYYVTTRYDRETQDGVTKRLHQEDFCQLLRCRPEVKYQDQGGPSIVECAKLLLNHAFATYCTADSSTDESTLSLVAVTAYEATDESTESSTAATTDECTVLLSCTTAAEHHRNCQKKGSELCLCELFHNRYKFE